MDGWSDQGVRPPSPIDCWDWLQLPHEREKEHILMNDYIVAILCHTSGHVSGLLVLHMTWLLVEALGKCWLCFSTFSRKAFKFPDSKVRLEDLLAEMMDDGVSVRLSKHNCEPQIHAHPHTLHRADWQHVLLFLSSNMFIWPFS